MANIDAPHGFRPWGPVLRARLYAVNTAPTINICVGDLVASGNTGLSCTGGNGTLLMIEDANIIPTTPGDATPILGAVLACYDEHMFPCDNAPSGYIAAGEVGDGTVAGYILVADHPDQQFEAQADGAISAAKIDLNHEITSGTLSAPNSATGLSTQEIASAGSNVTATIPLRLYGQAYPELDSIDAAGCRWICGINPDCHYWAAGTAI